MEFLSKFFIHLKHYTFELAPILLIGFVLSGLFYELVPEKIVKKYLVKKNFLTLFSIIVTGMILPICCIGSLPIAVGFRNKGVKLGNILAFLVATPATSISSILATLKFFGPIFTLYLCCSVIILGFIIGIIGNLLDISEKVNKSEEQTVFDFLSEFIPKKTFKQRLFSILKFSFIYLPKEIGFEVIIGVILASFISSLNIIKTFIENFLYGGFAYLFSVIFGVLMYMCSTASVPLVYALNRQGLAIGASLVLLILGPLTSYATILVIRKEFGWKVLGVYLLIVISFSLLSGYIYSLL